MRLRRIPEADQIVANSPFIVHNPQELRGMWRSASDKELHLEIGMGKGRFLIETASAHPDIDFVGMERYTSVLMRACERMEGIPYKTPADRIEQEEHPEREEAFAPPENLRFICADARLLMEYFAPKEVDVIYLNFSDPWPKARHADRRLTSKAFLERYEQVLRDGGRIEFKTDNIGLFTFSEEEIRSAPNWELTALTRDLHHDEVLCAGNIMTEYERKFSKLGNKIAKLIAVYHEPCSDLS